MSYETLTVAIGDDRVGLITMNRPEVRNAMNTQMMTDMRDCFAGFYVDPDVAACLVLTGAQGAFCSGGDLRERKGMTDAAWRRQHAIVEQMVRAIHRLPDPRHRRGQRRSLRRRHGAGAGVGLRLRGPSARFALTEVSLGIIPGAAARRICRAPWVCAAPRRSC